MAWGLFEQARAASAHWTTVETPATLSKATGELWLRIDCHSENCHTG